MQPFAFVRADDEESARAALRQGARALAGGTSLVDLLRLQVEQAPALVDLGKLPFRSIEQAGGVLRIGALATLSDIAGNPLIQHAAPSLAQAVLASASPQLRNAATIGGNLLQRTRCAYFRDTGFERCNKRKPGSGCAALDGDDRGHAVLGVSDHCIAAHASDAAVALTAFDATVRLRGTAGERSVAIADLLRLPGDTPWLEHTLAPDELIVAVELPLGDVLRRSAYRKLRDRASYAFALVSAAVGLVIEDGLVREARVALGGVGTVPWRAHAVEDALVGRPATQSSVSQAAQRAADGAVAGTQNGFKVELARRTVRRVLLQLAEDTAWK
ncbi:MAG: hydroxylase molybdopterin-containing subunit [Rhodospirillales bacterium]|jgi:xanthine dehydrogenase YagS FAD-binding subunit|nr:hydroxylase molybdopterin-containing subunit [Rhodospirillales bacterium]